MKDQEPRPSEKQPEHPATEPQRTAPQPELVFIPDERQAARVKRVRTLTLILTAVIMAGALIVVMLYRPNPRSSSDAPTRTIWVPPTETRSSVSVPDQRPTPRPGPASDELEVARRAAALIDTLAGRAAEKWLRASELTPQGVVTRDNGEELAAKLRRGVILADSARLDIALARQETDVVLKASRSAAPGAAYRLSALYAALDRYVKLLTDDSRDRASFYSTYEASVRALLLGDESEFETMQDVKTSYLRRSELRQRGIRRQVRQVKEALGNLDNVQE